MAYPVLLKAYIAFVGKMIAEGKISSEEGERLIREYKSKISE